MTNRSTLSLFAATLFTSAFLIFAVQPMAGKLLLPLLGGSPSVWNTAMVFFQAMLLAGYAYAHLTARFLPLKVQAILHLALLALFTFALPLALPPDVFPPNYGGQAWWQLCLMATIIGGPFFILAASAPLFQHWFAASGHPDAENPYFLYAVSNAGSLLALLSYPFVIEPLLTLVQQGDAWRGGYILLILLTAACAYTVRHGKKPAPPLPDVADDKGITWKMRGAWTILAFIPSSLMLSLTTYIATDLASLPLLWIIPLTLYLLTYIIAFSRTPWMTLPALRDLAGYALSVILVAFIIVSFQAPPFYVIIMQVGGFIVCAQLCHSQLAALKPAPAHLTEFFLLASLGGVLGGVFNALIAPVLFPIPLEYAISLSLVAFVIWAGAAHVPHITLSFNTIDDKVKKRKLMALDGLMLLIGVVTCVTATQIPALQIIGSIGTACFIFMLVQNRGVFALYCTFALLVFQSTTMWVKDKETIESRRNYFGVMRVFSYDDIHTLLHGTTMHGAQYQDKTRKLMPTTYYSPLSPIADVFYYFDSKSSKAKPQKFATLGLGVGSVNCYMAEGRSIDFYEIDQDVVKIAQNPAYFSYLTDCNRNYNIIVGDARLQIAKAPDEFYDLIFIDTFSSDAIPIHIITKEAFGIYLKKLKPGGIIVINVSNRYFDLRVPLAAIVEEMGLAGAYKLQNQAYGVNAVNPLDTSSAYVAIGRTSVDIAHFMEMEQWTPLHVERRVRPWSDDYANILPAFSFLSKP